MHFQFTFVYIASIFVYVVYCLFILFALGGSLFLAMLKFSAFHHFGFSFCTFLRLIKKRTTKSVRSFSIVSILNHRFRWKRSQCAATSLSLLIALCASLCFFFAADLVRLSFSLSFADLRFAYKIVSFKFIYLRLYKITHTPRWPQHVVHSVYASPGQARPSACGSLEIPSHSGICSHALFVIHARSNDLIDIKYTPGCNTIGNNCAAGPALS